MMLLRLDGRGGGRHPSRITALIPRNGNAYVEGFTPFWDGLFAYAADGVTNAVRASLELAGQRWMYAHGVPAGWTASRRTPGRWTRPA